MTSVLVPPAFPELPNRGSGTAAPARDTAPPAPRAPGWLRAGALLALAAGLALSVAYAFVRAPWWDEGLYADVARQFARHGVLRSPLMGPWGSFGFGDVPRMNERTYWTTPLYPVAVGLWFRAAGEGLVQMRLVSIACAALLVGAWGAVVRALTGSRDTALLAAGLMALNSHVLWSASIGRPEALSAGLAALAAAAYLRWRERHLLGAACSAAGLLAASALAHPLSAVGGVALVAAALVLDWRRLRVGHVAAALAVGLLVLSPWAAYIAQDPDTFRAQWAVNMGTNAGGRGAGLAHPLRAVLTDFRGRYLTHTYLDVRGAARVLVVELAAVLACCALAVAAPGARRQRGAGLVALMAGASWVALAVLDGSRYRQYFVQVFPALIALTAVGLYHLATSGGRVARTAAAACALALTVPGAGGVLNRIAAAPYHAHYLPAADVARRCQRAGATVVGGSELAFSLGFDSPLRDDMDLHAPADVYVQSEWYLFFTAGHPVRDVLARDYHVASATPRYTVYVRNGAPPPGRAGAGCA